jgi:hypothetical protein
VGNPEHHRITQGLLDFGDVHVEDDLNGASWIRGRTRSLKSAKSETGWIFVSDEFASRVGLHESVPIDRYTRV